MASITDHQVRAFLQHSTRTGKLAYLGARGTPLVAPIWFILEGNELIFNTGRDTAKGGALARHPRVTLCVDLEEQPYAFVQVQAEATISEEPKERLRIATAIGTRYMGADRGVEFGRRNAVDGELVVYLRPTKVNAVFDMTA